MHADAYISLNICAHGAVMHTLSVLAATWIQAPSSERHLAQGWAVCSCTRLLYKHMCFRIGAPFGSCYNTVVPLVIWLYSYVVQYRGYQGLGIIMIHASSLGMRSSYDATLLCSDYTQVAR